LTRSDGQRVVVTVPIKQGDLLAALGIGKMKRASDFSVHALDMGCNMDPFQDSRRLRSLVGRISRHSRCLQPLWRRNW
jgi:hypothetical protein